MSEQEQQSDDTGGDVDAAVESKARAMGWRPKSEFKGDPERFVDAAEYVRKGEEMLPIVKAENRRLQEQLAQQNGQLAELRNLVKTNNEAIEALKEANDATAKLKARESQRNLRTAIEEARKEGETDRVVELQEQLDAVTAQLQAPAPTKKEAPKEEPTQPTLDPVTQQWMKDNPWYGTDRRRTALANAIGQELRANGDTSVGKEFYDKVYEGVDEAMPFEGARKRNSKVEGGGGGSSNGGGGGSGGGQSYNSLPAEAKAICDRQAAKLVGKGRTYENIDAWRKAYATKYFNS